jgi:hypothetical protein
MFAMGAKSKALPEAPAAPAASGDRHPRLQAALDAATAAAAAAGPDKPAAAPASSPSPTDAPGGPPAPAAAAPPAALPAPEQRPMQLLLDVTLDAPILALPLTSRSPDHIEIDLGTLLVHNRIVWELRGGAAGGEAAGQKVLIDDMRVRACAPAGVGRGVWLAGDATCRCC